MPPPLPSGLQLILYMPAISSCPFVYWRLKRQAWQAWTILHLDGDHFQLNPSKQDLRNAWFHKNEGGNAAFVTSTSSWSIGFIEPVSFLCYLSCCSGNASEVENLILLGLTIGMVRRKPSERNGTAHCVQTTVWPTIRQGQLQNKNSGHRQTSGTSGIWTGLYIEPVPIPGFQGEWDGDSSNEETGRIASTWKWGLWTSALWNCLQDQEKTDMSAKVSVNEQKVDCGSLDGLISIMEIQISNLSLKRNDWWQH